MLAFETKNNKNKVAKWTAAALLAGADMIKLGYVSRIGPRDNFNHILLGTQVRQEERYLPFALDIAVCSTEIAVLEGVAGEKLAAWCVCDAVADPDTETVCICSLAC